METFLIIVVVVLGLIAFAQVIRIFELSSQIKGDKEEHDTNDKDNRTQGILLLVFGILFLLAFWLMTLGYSEKLLPKSASLHGIKIDSLWDISMWLIVVAFVIIEAVLFYFAFRYRGSKKRKAVYMEHNNKLEFVWTVVPAVVLAGLIIYGLSTWSEVMNPTYENEEPMVVEIYARQFVWTARYSGADNTLGYANVGLVEGTNTLGLDVNDMSSLDDVITPVLHLPVGRPVTFKFRAQDVIHSAFLPQFRVQMNCVPGTPTQFSFVPIVTTEEMRKDPHVIKKVANINEIRAAKGEEPYQYDYLLLCNKICGSAHYNMQMKVVVETQEEYDKWMSEQKSFAEAL